MTFEEWWDKVFKAPPHGLMEEHMREAFEAGLKEGYNEGFESGWEEIRKVAAELKEKGCYEV